MRVSLFLEIEQTKLDMFELHQDKAARNKWDGYNKGARQVFPIEVYLTSCSNTKRRLLRTQKKDARGFMAHCSKAYLANLADKEGSHS